MKLEDVYTGKMYNVDIKRKRVCKTCNGKGGENVENCTKCKGKGVVEKLVMLGPNMYSQSRAHCDNCHGEGHIIKQGSQCMNLPNKLK